MRKDFTTYHLHRPIVMGYNLKLGCGLEKLRTSFAFSLALTSSSSSLQDIVCEYSLPLFRSSVALTLTCYAVFN